jgi:sulfur-oxidizing protein SoxZ
VIQGQTGTSISRNPVFGFKVKGAKAGDKVVIKWRDNKGDSRTDEATIG